MSTSDFTVPSQSDQDCRNGLIRFHLSRLAKLLKVTNHMRHELPSRILLPTHSQLHPLAVLNR